ncbi:MAG TPA: ABC transporter permease [Bryobacteraceae bacterium]
MSWFNRLSNLLRRENLGRELDEELQFHIDARTRDNLESGMTEEAARRDARRRFGNRTLAKEETHDMNILVPIQTVGQDLRYALRTLRKSPGFTALAVLAMALGIGANTAVFTVVNGVLLRPLPLVEPGRLLLISYGPSLGPFSGRPTLPDHDFLEFQRRSQAFERVTMFGRDQVTLTGAGDAVRLPAALVTSSFFPVLRVNPAMGRTFGSGDEQPGSPAVAVLSQELWRSRFAADPNILGKIITVNGIKRSVIGVMPPGFAFPTDTALWLPLTIRTGPATAFLPAFGRLQPSVSRRQAQAELETLAPRLPWQHRDAWTAEVLPLEDLFVGGIRKSLLIFMGAVALVLLVACANVANLLLMKGSLRRQEMAVRTALGAPRSRLIRQLLTESAMLSLGGAMAGLLSAVVGVRALLHLTPPGIIPRVAEIHLDATVIGFALGLAAVTGILFGLLPAVQATGRDLRTFLSQAGRAATGRGDGLRSVLVVAEIALTLVLLTGAGLLLKSFLRIRAVDPGFRAENVLTMTVDLPESLYNTLDNIQAFHARTLENLSNLPGVLAAGAVNFLPFNGVMFGLFHLYDGRPTPPGYMVDKPAVSSEYFRLMGIPLLSGRAFSSQDNSTAPRVAILSQSVARAFWPDGNALGQRVTLQDHPTPGKEDWLTIVGVVDDVRQRSLTEKVHPAIYQPYTQVTKPPFLSSMTFAIRTAAPPATMAAAMRGVLREVDRNQPAQSIATMTEVVAKTTAQPQFQTRLIAIFSMLALLLAAIGVYGVLACAAAERTREIGIRMALGAGKSDITRMILRRSLILVTVGVALGVAGALAVTRVLAKFLFEVKPTDLPTFLLVAALLVAVALLAGWLPSQRATRVDPLIALRWE